MFIHCRCNCGPVYSIASVFIERSPENVLAIIEDDGRGFDETDIDWHDRHLGLYRIRERAELFSRQFTIETVPGQGTSVYIELPLKIAD